MPFDVYCTVGARSEALASAQLELHGLHDMLENLLSWISDAEGKMSETEAMPIGTDLETVEKQLSEHEVQLYMYVAYRYASRQMSGIWGDKSPSKVEYT